MTKIKIMDDILANKIAAGEVVERCSSVVKELTENAIDAKSTVIKVELIDSGTKEIKITDDGIGMEKEDALLAFERHATSKLLDEEDLYRIHTLGFRGEALPAIASVSKVEMITSKGNVGTILHIEGGKFVDASKGDARRGTIIKIKDLFYNTPARLKHMKSLYTELASVTDYMNKLALSYPSIRFCLVNNGNVLLNTDGSGNLLKTFSCIFGLQVAKKMIEIHVENDDYIIDGFISLPEVQRASRNHMILIVNGRVVRNMDLLRTIHDAYHPYQPDNRYPIVVLKIDVDSSLIDVNIHPTKMDIKFSKIDTLQSLIRNSIEKALQPKTLIPEIEDKFFKEASQNLVLENEEPYTKKMQYENLTLSLERSKEEPSLDKEAPIFITKEKNHEKLPELYPIGSLHGTYIICQNEKGMYLIDQHAAKERINYEQCLQKLSSKQEKSIRLLVPFTIELTNSEALILKENLELLHNMKFDITEFGVNSFVIKAHPLWLSKYKVQEAIQSIVDLVIHKEKNFDLSRFHDHVAATMACKMSIKANDLISMKEMEYLISDLRMCENPFHCPHGRPTMVFYSNSDLEKMFKRSGFDTYQ